MEANYLIVLNNGFASLKSHVGMIIITTKLDTQAKVKNIYGGTTWTLISGRFLMGATTSDIGEIGGASSHSHISPIGFDPNFAYCWADASGNPLYGSSVNTGIRSIINMSNPTESGIGRYAMTTSESNLPPYKKVYIWERTA